MEHDFKIDQTVVCVTLNGYDGEVLDLNKILTINFVGNNVIGFKEHVKEDGTPIKFFKHYFVPQILKKKRMFRKGDGIKYRAANWTVVEQIGDNLLLNYNGGGEDDVFINILTDEYRVTSQRFFSRDKITLVSLDSIQRYLDGDYYYMGNCSTLKRTLHDIYLELEEKKFITINRSFDGGIYFNIKGKEKNFYIPMEMAILLEEGKKIEKIKIGSTIKFKKGKQALIVGNTYKVEDVLHMSSKTILGLKTDKGRVYVNQKQCKIIKIKKINEKTMVKTECKDIF